MRILGLTLGNWRAQSTQSADMLAHLNLVETPGVYVFSARACGLKGVLSGARHSWISVFDGIQWTTVEITDEETLGLQRTMDGNSVIWKCYGSPSKANSYRAPYRNNRAADGFWFGQRPRLELSFIGYQLAIDFLGQLDKICIEYRFKDSFALHDNNCSKFVSYLLWRSGSARGRGAVPLQRINLIGFRGDAYWQSIYFFDDEAERNIAGFPMPVHRAEAL